jgi:SH3 domain-containing protein
MYSVTAPAIDCDIQSGNRPDNANQQKETETPKSDFVIGPETSSRREFKSVEPDEIAAKILQMHVAADVLIDAAASRPKLVDGEEDPSFEMPGILLRPRNEPLLESQSTASATEKALEPKIVVPRKNGPSFKALLLSTLVVAGAGGGALALGMANLFQQDDPTSRFVETELITPSHTIESLIAADTLSSAQDSSKSTLLPNASFSAAATSRQVAVAKQRIRNAFAVGNTGNSSLALSDLKENHSAGLSDEKAQERLARIGTSVAAKASPRSANSYPQFASTARDVPIPRDFSGQRRPARTEQIERSQPGQNLSGAAAKQAPQSSTIKTTADVSYPNVGKILASVNFRNSEDKDATVLAVIPENTEVRFDECGTWWCGVLYDGQTGYVGQKFLEKTAQKVE